MTTTSDCPACRRVGDLLRRAEALMANMPGELQAARAAGSPVDPIEYVAMVVRETLDAVREAVEGVGEPS